MRAIGWMIGGTLTVAAGCTQSGVTDRPNVDGGQAVAVLDQPAPLGVAQAPAGAELNPPEGAVAIGARLDAAQTPIAPLGAASVAIDPGADPVGPGGELVVPPPAWRRASDFGVPNDWRRTLGSGLARASEAPEAELERLKAAAVSGHQALRSSIGATFAGSLEELQDIVNRGEQLDAGLAGMRGQGVDAARAWLDRQSEQLSTAGLAEERVTIGFRGVTGSGQTAPAPSLAADLGGGARLPAKVQVGIDLNEQVPGLAAAVDAVEAAARRARGQQPPSGLAAEPGGAGTDAAASGAAGGLRMSVADRYDDLSWWLAAGLAPDAAAGAVVRPDLDSDRAVDVGAGLQYELGPKAAVAAEYGYRGPTDRMIDSLSGVAAGQRTDEQLHSAGLRFIWRFEDAPASDPAAGK